MEFYAGWVTRWRRDSMACAAKDAPRRERGSARANTCSERPQSMRTSPMRTLTRPIQLLHRHAFAAARVLRFSWAFPEEARKKDPAVTARDCRGRTGAPEARFYLAINLHNYDQQYERQGRNRTSCRKYPSNALFQLARGDLFAKLGNQEKARDCYRAAGAAA